SFGLFGDGAVTTPPVPPGFFPTAAALSSGLVCGHSVSSISMVQVLVDAARSQTQPQPAGVEELLASSGAGPKTPGASAVGLQNDEGICTLPPASTLQLPPVQSLSRYPSTVTALVCARPVPPGFGIFALGFRTFSFRCSTDPDGM